MHFCYHNLRFYIFWNVRVFMEKLYTAFFFLFAIKQIPSSDWFEYWPIPVISVLNELNWTCVSRHGISVCWQGENSYYILCDKTNLIFLVFNFFICNSPAMHVFLFSRVHVKISVHITKHPLSHFLSLYLSHILSCLVLPLLCFYGIYVSIHSRRFSHFLIP